MGQAAGSPIVRTSSTNRGCARRGLKAGRTPIQHSSGDRSRSASASQESASSVSPRPTWTSAMRAAETYLSRRRCLSSSRIRRARSAWPASAQALPEARAELRRGGRQAARVPDRGQGVVGPLHPQVRLAQEEVGHGEAAVGLQGLLERGRRLHEASREVVDEAEARLDGGGEGVGLLGELDLPGRPPRSGASGRGSSSRTSGARSGTWRRARWPGGSGARTPPRTSRTPP